MTLVSNVNGVSAPLSDSNGFVRPNARKNPMSLAHLAKTAGVLALALGGGGQVAGARNSFGHGRELQIFQPSDWPGYQYSSSCESGILDSHDEGLNYEDCMFQEEASLQATRVHSEHEATKRCYTVTGYITAGFAGGSGLATIGLSKAGLEVAGIGGGLTAVTLIITSVCGIWHRYSGSQLQSARDAVVKCCSFFPKQADIVDAENADVNKRADNSTATSNETATSTANATANATSNSTTLG